jgi:hypothetical protein
METPEDALACFSRLDLDVLFVGSAEYGREHPEQIVLAAVPGWQRVLADVLSSDRNRAFLDHIAVRVEVPRRDVEAAVAVALPALRPSTLAATPALADLETVRRRYLLARLFFLLRREGLAMAPGAPRSADDSPRPAASVAAPS